MARGIVVLGLLGAGAYFAYARGYLPQLAPVVEAASRWVPENMWDAPQRAQAEQSAAIKDASGGQVVPILGAGEVVSVNAYEGTLRENWGLVSGWAKQNVHYAAAIMRTENSRINPAISGDNGTSHGIYQVKVATAETCYRAGYTRYPPTKETLLTIEGGVYFGTAEMERLSKYAQGSDKAWVVKAFNGGAGWEHMGAKYAKDREAYYKRAIKNMTAMYGGSMV